MYYVVPNEYKEAMIYGFDPKVPYIPMDEFPVQPEFKEGYYPLLYADLSTNKIWWDYVEIPKPPPKPTYEELVTALDILTGGKDDELDQIISDNP